MLSALPQFPSFIEARTMLIAEEASQNKNKTPPPTETALLASKGAASSGYNSGTRPDSGDRNGSANNSGRGGLRPNNSSNGSRNGGRDRGRGRDGNRGNSYNNGNYSTNGCPSLQQQQANWASLFPPWGAAWRAPWTRATGPGVNTRPPYQTYNISMPTTTSTLSTWDTTGLMQALHAASVQQ
jgi:hypothetical protein